LTKIIFLKKDENLGKKKEKTCKIQKKRKQMWGKIFKKQKQMKKKMYGKLKLNSQPDHY
jgi:hypothetical protein